MNTDCTPLITESRPPRRRRQSTQRWKWALPIYCATAMAVAAIAGNAGLYKPKPHITVPRGTVIRRVPIPDAALPMMFDASQPAPQQTKALPPGPLQR